MATRTLDCPPPPDPTAEAGRAAELQAARDLTARLAGTGSALHTHRRIPDLMPGGRRKIDFVVTRPDEVILLETKNGTAELHIDHAGHFAERAPHRALRMSTCRLQARVARRSRRKIEHGS